MPNPTKEQLEFVRVAWGLSGEIRFLRRVANFVYEASLAGRPVILRLTEPAHRQSIEIAAELHWMDYLSSRGMKVAGPLRSQAGEFVVKVPEKPGYFAALFEKAPGGFLRDETELNETMIRSWGAYLGRLHRLTQEYEPPAAGSPRQEWDKDDTLITALRGLDPKDRVPYERMSELMAWMRQLPKEKNVYGLVHCDLHQGNFFVDKGVITAFDFDDSCRHWFVYDITPAIFSMLNSSEDNGLSLTSEGVLKPFLEGYGAENSLSTAWLKRFDGFMAYRAGLVYHWIKACSAEGVFDEKALEWCRRRTPGLLRALTGPLRLS